MFADRDTIDLATGAAVGAALANPDNLAVDHDGNMYIVEDGGAVDNDIWFAKDLNSDGDLADAEEGIGRWASNGTVGSEFTGLYFDPTDKRRAGQHSTPRERQRPHNRDHYLNELAGRLNGEGRTWFRPGAPSAVLRR